MNDRLFKSAAACSLTVGKTLHKVCREETKSQCDVQNAGKLHPQRVERKPQRLHNKKTDSAEQTSLLHDTDSTPEGNEDGIRLQHSITNETQRAETPPNMKRSHWSPPSPGPPSSERIRGKNGVGLSADVRVKKQTWRLDGKRNKMLMKTL